jgi:hypothetical protein
MIISEKHAVQHGEKARNSLGLNYKSAALDQLSYAGKNAAHISARCRLKQVADRFVVVVWRAKTTQSRA